MTAIILQKSHNRESLPGRMRGPKGCPETQIKADSLGFGNSCDSCVVFRLYGATGMADPFKSPNSTTVFPARSGNLCPEACLDWNLSAATVAIRL